MSTQPKPNVTSPVGAPPSPVTPGTETRALDAATPVLFLPVNIETRFMDIRDGRSQLWVRIYPDQIAIDSHEAELTAQEITDGETYWNAVWRAGNPPPSLDAVKAPWRGLASLYGAQRAAWIALEMTPTNVSQQPVAPTPDGSDPNPAPIFPAPAQRPSSWNKPAVADSRPAVAADYWRWRCR